eukprot:13321420-Alexandrium_andersonii.AAC.1
MRVQKQLYEQWQHDAESYEYFERAHTRSKEMSERRKEDREKGQRSNAKDIWRRNLKSFWRTSLYLKFGGELWWKLFIACGRVTDPMVRPRARPVTNT